MRHGHPRKAARREPWGIRHSLCQLTHDYTTVSRIYKRAVLNISFQRDVADIASLHPRDFVNAALAAGECYSIRDALRKKGIDTKVKTVLRNLKLATRDVEGSEG